MKQSKGLKAHLKKVKQLNLERLKELKEKKKNKTLKGIDFEELRMLQEKYRK
jgi:hypothetical protein